LGPSSSALISTITPIEHPYNIIIMPTKAEKTYLKRMNSLKSALGNMAMDGTMTQDTHVNLLNILATEVEVRKPKSMSKQPLFPIVSIKKKDEAVVVNRTEIPDEIPPPISSSTDDHPPPPPSPPLLEDDHLQVPDIPVKPELDEVHVEDAPPVPDSNSVQTSIFGNVRHNTMMFDGLSAQPDAHDDDDDRKSDTSSWTFPPPKDEAKDRSDTSVSRAVDVLSRRKTYADSHYDVFDHMDGKPYSDLHRKVDEKRIVTKKGCLFMTCVRCVSMIMIKFESGLVPSMPLSSSTQYENGIAMTMCKECAPEEESPSTTMSSDESPISYTDQFKKLGMDPQLLRGTVMARTANLVTNDDVPMMTFKGCVL
jgi:hypothetical protein